jgi:uncharacterized protein (DUF1330 family)
MSAYLIIQASVDDWENFSLYTQALTPLIKQFGGEYIAMGAPELIEGHNAPKSMVISQWCNCDAAHKFWNSEEYAIVKKYREGTGEFNIMLIDGLSTTPLE